MFFDLKTAAKTRLSQLTSRYSLAHARTCERMGRRAQKHYSQNKKKPLKALQYLFNYSIIIKVLIITQKQKKVKYENSNQV